MSPKHVMPLCIALFLTPLTGFANHQAPAKPLNVLLIVVDDLGWSDLACYGADLHQTPNIDSLCKDSLKFTDAYAAASICTPTRASIMTGIYPAKLNMTIWHEAANRNPPTNRALIPPQVEANLAHHHMTLAESFQQASYHTAHLGKWHLGTAGFYPELHGFDVNIGGTFWGCPATFFYPYRGPFGSRQELRYVPQLGGGQPGEYLTDRLTDEAIQIIRTSTDKPFFLNMCYYTVHTPIEGKPELAKKYTSLLKDGQRHSNAHYAAMVQSLDENVGRLLTELKQQDILDQTIVILTSDNGGFINKFRGNTVTNNAPLRSGKGSLYEGGVRVPLLIRWPNITTPNSVCHEPVTTCDFYPTLQATLNLPSNIEHNLQVDGNNLITLLKNPSTSLNRGPLFWHYPHYYQTTDPVSSIRDGDWKLLKYHSSDRVELFNLAEDISEANNLATKQPQTTEKLLSKLAAWQTKVNAQMPTLNTQFKQKR